MWWCVYVCMCVCGGGLGVEEFGTWRQLALSNYVAEREDATGHRRGLEVEG